MKTRAQRRHEAERIKAKTKRKLEVYNKNSFLYHHYTPREIGRAAAMHCTHQCWMCQMHDDTKRKQLLTDLLKLQSDE